MVRLKPVELMVYLLTIITSVVVLGCAIVGIFEEASVVVYIVLVLLTINLAMTHLPKRKSLDLIMNIVLIMTLTIASFALSKDGMLVIALSLIWAYGVIGIYQIRSEK